MHNITSEKLLSDVKAGLKLSQKALKDGKQLKLDIQKAKKGKN